MNQRVMSIFGVVAVMSVAAFSGDKAHAGGSHGHHGHDHAQEAGVEVEQAPAQKTCPVMGGAVNKELFEDHNGQRVYFCCEGCRKPFKENPAKYIKILEEKGEHIEQVSETVPQETCPVMGSPIKKTVYADYEGKRVYFCCEGCINTFKANPAKYLQKLEEKGVRLESI